MALPDTEVQHEKDWVRYRMEWRHPFTDEVLHREDSNTPKGPGGTAMNAFNDKNETSQPIFELVTSFRARLIDETEKQGQVNLKLSTQSKPLYTLKIYSIAIINALQAVVRYYPGQDLSGDTR
jgi:hypothetical protein